MRPLGSGRGWIWVGPPSLQKLLIYSAILAGAPLWASTPPSLSLVQTVPSRSVQPGIPAEKKPLTLDEALALAEKFNPHIRVALAGREGAEAGILTARAYPNPEVTAIAGRQFSRWNRGITGAPGSLTHFSTSQQIELPSVRRWRLDAAERGREGSQHTVSEARLSVRRAVRQAFFQVLRQRAEVEVAEDNLQLIEELRRKIEVQVEVGEAARLELVRAEAEVAIGRTLVRSARLRLVTATSALRATINAPPDLELEPAGAFEEPPPLPPLERIREEMFARHPALKAAQSEIQRAESALKTETAMRKPQPSFYADYERQPDLDFTRFGVTIPVPLWNKREGPIAEAAARVNQTRALAEARRTELIADLENAYGQYEVASEQLQSFREGVLKEAEAALQAAEAAFRFGERGIIEVLDAQRVLRSVRSDFLSAQFDLQAAVIDIQQLRAIE